MPRKSKMLKALGWKKTDVGWWGPTGIIIPKKPSWNHLYGTAKILRWLTKKPRSVPRWYWIHQWENIDPKPTHAIAYDFYKDEK